MEVPNGGMLFYPAFKNDVLDSLVNTFQKDLAAFDRAAAFLNGKKLKMGDSGAVFAAFPKIPLAVLMWQADEEFGGSANLLFDSTIEYFSPSAAQGDGSFVMYKQHKRTVPLCSGMPCALGIGMLIFHNLTYAQNIDPSGHWIAGGKILFGMLRNRVFLSSVKLEQSMVKFTIQF